jgi:hypothetical protein
MSHVANTPPAPRVSDEGMFEVEYAPGYQQPFSMSARHPISTGNPLRKRAPTQGAGTLRGRNLTLRARGSAIHDFAGYQTWLLSRSSEVAVACRLAPHKLRAPQEEVSHDHTIVACAHFLCVIVGRAGLLSAGLFGAGLLGAIAPFRHRRVRLPKMHAPDGDIQRDCASAPGVTA